MALWKRQQMTPGIFYFWRLLLYLATWEPGGVFKNLDTQQSEIIIEFQHKINSILLRIVFRNVKQFQVLFWLCNWRNFQAWAYYKISMFWHLLYFDSGANSHRLKSKQITVEPLWEYLIFVYQAK